MASVDEEVAQKTLHILEGLNAASSAGESEDEDGDAAKSAPRVAEEEQRRRVIGVGTGREANGIDADERR